MEVSNIKTVTKHIKYITPLVDTNCFVGVPVVTMHAPRSTAVLDSQPTIEALSQTKQQQSH